MGGKERAAEESRIFYRTVKHAPPTRQDFFSGKQQGKPMPKRPHQVHLWEGISTRDNFNEARRRALANPHQGRFIAAIEIPGDGRITYERTGTNEGHYTLWGDPDTLLSQVIALEPVRIVQEE
jgi:hypothetical protein